MSEDKSTRPRNLDISRRRLLQGAVAITALSALSSCTGGKPRGLGSPSTTLPVASRTSPLRKNVRVTRDGYREHVGPSVACNPRDPDQLIVACQASPVIPELVVTYISSDGGATWQNGGQPPQPAAGPAGDDVTVAYDVHGRGYICATRSGQGNNLQPSNPDANRAVYVWHTDDGGRTYSSPVTVVQGVYCDHPWLATGGPNPSHHDVYVVWGAGASHTALELARSTDGGQTFASPYRILNDSTVASLMSAGPQIAAGTSGLVCAVCDWTTHQDPSGDMVGEVVAVCSTDAGRTFAAPVHLGSESAAIALADDVKPNSGPTIAMSPRGDAIYVAFPVHQPRAVHSDVMVTASHEGGRTWSKPMRATPADDRIYFQPNLAVDTAGRVAISTFALANGRIDEILLISQPDELRFGPPLQVTTASFDPQNPTTASRGKYGAWWIGDWQGLTTSPGAFHVVWNDTRTGKLDLFAATVRP